MNFEICKKCIRKSLRLRTLGYISDCKKLYCITSIHLTLSDTYHTRCFLSVLHPVKVVISDIYNIVADKRLFFAPLKYDSPECRECLVRCCFESVIFDKIDIDSCRMSEESGGCPYALDHQVHYWNLEK